MSSTDPAFLVPENVLHRVVDGQLVLLDLDSEQYFGLDEIGAAMVRLITTLPAGEAEAALLDEYDVEPDRLRADLEEMIASLVEAGLLTPVDDPG